MSASRHDRRSLGVICDAVWYRPDDAGALVKFVPTLASREPQRPEPKPNARRRRQQRREMRRREPASERCVDHGQ